MRDLDASLAAIPDVHYEILKLLTKDKDSVIEFRDLRDPYRLYRKALGIYSRNQQEGQLDWSRILSNRFQGSSRRGAEILRRRISTQTIWSIKIARLQSLIVPVGSWK
jgi:hypothetical protein